VPSLLLGVAAVLGSALPAAAAPSGDAPAPGAQVTLTVFWGDGCPRCAEQEVLLDRLAQEHPSLTVERHEVWFDETGAELFRRTADGLGFEAGSVPTTIVGERVWIGHTEAIGEDLERTVAAAVAGDPVPWGIYGRGGEGTCDAGALCEAPEPATVDVPLLGETEIGSGSSASLVLSTLAIGFVDGVNPCSLWVISILLAIVIRTGSRRRVLAVGSIFLAVTAGMYAVYMAGIYSALTVVGYLGWVQVVVGVVALVFGALSVKDYVAFRRGPSLTIPDGSKPGIYQRMRRIAGQQTLVPALAATAALAVAVSLLETPCTAGFPILWTGLLAEADVSAPAAAGLFGLYMVPFLLDELVVFGAAVATMRAARLQETHGRVLKLVAGTTMLALAGVMLLAPEVMEDVLGATLVFLAAALAAAAAHGTTLLLRRRRRPAPDPAAEPPGPGPATDTAPEPVVGRTP
jgi:hypothetical protein